MLSKPQLDAYDLSRSVAGKSLRSACYAPYVSLYFNTLGEVIACCKNESFVLGNVAADGLDQIWNGGRIEQLRKALARYDFGAGCGQCEWQIHSGNFGGVYTRIFEEFAVDSPAPKWPAMMEFTLSNTCNFECVMCYGELSSSIRGHREGLPPLPRVYDDRFFADLGKYLPHLRRAKFFGGEPFLAQENFRVFEMMIALGLQTQCHVTTNGSIWNDRVLRVLDHLPTSISISLDGATAATFESIRVNGKFDQVMRNARRFREHCRQRGTSFSITCCLMRQNWREFGQMLLIAEELECDAWVNTVINPSSCSLYTLPATEALAIADLMETDLAQLAPQLKRNLSIYASEIANLRAHAKGSLAGEVEQLKEDRKEERRSVEGAGADHVSPAWELAGAGKFEEALAEVQKTSENNPRYWYSLALRAHLYRRMGQIEKCEAQIAECIALTPRRAEPYAERAWLRLSQQRIAEGIADAERSLELASAADDSQAAALHVLGALLSASGESARALEVFARVKTLRPGNPFIRVGYGWAQLKAGRPDLALDEAESALGLSAGIPDAIELRRVVLGSRHSLETEAAG
ncbi:MAG: radical SAM protein [Planctomycetes bacterium]|nr:radical SAM protein [Planctomycetota bacterium]